MKQADGQPDYHPEFLDVLISRIEQEVIAIRRLGDGSFTGACERLLASRGKMLRGRLVLAASLQGVRENTDAVGSLALAVEMLHLASLAHDDIIDTGTHRRGAPSVGAVFGNRVAGCAGSWVFARAAEVVATDTPSVMRRFSDTSVAVCDGGIQELRGAFDTSRTFDDYLEVAEKKTASVFMLALAGGAEATGSSAESVSKLCVFARQFGIAWQIWDDLSDICTEPSVRGKDALSDLRHGIYTLPTIYAIDENPEIPKLLADTQLSDLNEAKALAMIKETCGIERAVAMARNHAQRAADSLDDLPRQRDLYELLEQAVPSHLTLGL